MLKDKCMKGGTHERRETYRKIGREEMRDAGKEGNIQENRERRK